MTEPRFFIDHGMIHDRLTGKHVTTDEDSVFQDGIKCCTDLLNGLVADAERVAIAGASFECVSCSGYGVVHRDGRLSIPCPDCAGMTPFYRLVWALEQAREVLSRLDFATDAKAFAASQASGLEIIDRALTSAMPIRREAKS